MSDDRWTEEQKAAHEAAKKLPKRVSADPPPVPCRRHVDNPVTPEEIAAEAEKYAPKENE